jgi:hypothetical protein
MGLWKALSSIFSPSARVLDRLKALEAQETARELRAVELADQVKRHLARLAELDRRAEKRAAEPDAALGGKPSAQELLAMKYPRAG